MSEFVRAKFSHHYTTNEIIFCKRDENKRDRICSFGVADERQHIIRAYRQQTISGENNT
ncbi:MAG: hypothetical protein Q7J09_01110 [Methanocalculus sp.]|uniref:hypothetical protein n=1 Tax=Methanocalculus sp. TaxID=2004547 RepID=UPI00272863B9|nr:hypothetical protein [Methanocalculus sp.]MDO8842411.1 hypothetical protein [Methanocalculus sp.]MDO9538591.1 hypothetical protein [Methanocalculus sp.]